MKRKNDLSAMPAPYSIDLRQGVIDAYEGKEGSQRQIAQRFQVSPSCVKRLIHRYRETGTVEPKSHGGGARAIIKQSELKQIKQLVDEQPDVLLRELCDRWETKKGVKVSISTMHRRLEELNLTTKKNSICQGTGNSEN